jgi:hypothetical protein
MSKIQLRRDTAANWTSANPTLSSGELGFETDTGKFKIGNAAGTAWTSLAYAAVTAYGDLSGAPAAYSLPTATTSVLGGVKVDGTTITIASGVISASASSYTLPTATTAVLGGVKVDGTSITISSGVISSSYSYTLPAASVSVLGGVRLGTGVGLDANGFLISDVKLTTNTFTGTQNLGGNLITQPKLQAYRETSTAPTISAGTLTLDLSGSNFFAVSLNAAITTLTISNTPASSAASFTLEFTADGTARAVTWGAAIKWSGGTAPTLTSTSGKKDVFAFYSNDGGTSWQGFTGGQNF